MVEKDLWWWRSIHYSIPIVIKSFRRRDQPQQHTTNGVDSFWISSYSTPRPFLFCWPSSHYSPWSFWCLFSSIQHGLLCRLILIPMERCALHFLGSTWKVLIKQITSYTYLPRYKEPADVIVMNQLGSTSIQGFLDI